MVTSKITGFIVRLTLLVLLWCIFANAYMIGIVDKSPLLFLIFFIVVTSTFYFITKKSTKLVAWVGANKRWLAFILGCLIVLSVVFRLSFTMLDLASSNISQLPFAYTYSLILSLVTSWLGDNQLTVIVLNTFLDIMACVFLYLFMRNNKASKLLSLAVVAIWMTNPFTVFFSVFSLPISLLNALLIVLIYLIHKIYLNVPKFTALLSYSALVGLVMALANSVRPVAIAFIIALLIFYALILIQNSKRKVLIGNLTASWLIIVAVLSLLLNIQADLINRAIGTETKSVTGWSIFVGEDHTTTDPHQTSQEMVIGKSASHTPFDQAELVVRKALVFGGDQKNAVASLNDYPNINKNPDTYKVFKAVAAVFSWIVLTVGALLFYRMSQQKGKVALFVHYLALILLGLFMTSLLVEVTSRHFAPLFVILIMLTGLVMKAYVDGNKPKAAVD